MNMTDSNSLPPASAPGPFEVVVTDDGSYTARIGAGETMHSMRGALGETVYIYGSAFERIHQMLHAEAKTPRILSLGLGLSFVEIVAAAVAVKFETPLSGESFELDPRLIQSFKNWVAGGAEIPGHIPHMAYDKALEMTAAAYNLSSKIIQEKLIDALGNETWVLSGPLLPDTFRDRPIERRRFNAVAFDAFSSKSTPELWTREFLDPFLKEACDTNCVLSTYACTGHLKRALVDAGFTLEIREGFASKRDSTLACRAMLV